jgi:hypothetical protein
VGTRGFKDARAELTYSEAFRRYLQHSSIRPPRWQEERTYLSVTMLRDRTTGPKSGMKGFKLEAQRSTISNDINEDSKTGSFLLILVCAGLVS